jgi:hypothetical protein
LQYHRLGTIGLALGDANGSGRVKTRSSTGQFRKAFNAQVEYQGKQMKRIPQRFTDREVTNLLEEQEKIIRDRMRAVEEVAQALKTIRDEKLYRLTYKTFNDYCRQVWGFGKDKAYRLINHTQISSLQGSSTSQNATNSDNVVDDTGQPVPARLVAIFQCARVFRQVIARLDRIASALKEIEESRSYQIAEQEARKHGGETRQYSSVCLTAARRLADWRPAVVCPVCTGVYEPSPDNDVCARCGGKGYLTATEIEE